MPSTEVYSITGDNAGNLWLSGNHGLSHLRDGRLIEHFPWSALGRHQQAKVIVFDRERGGLWLSFWTDGGVEYFKDGQVRASYTAADGLGKGHVPGLRLDRDGAVWAATEDGGLSRIKDGHIATLTTSEWFAVRHDSLVDRGRRSFLMVVHGVRTGAHRAGQNWTPGSPTRRAGLKRRFGMRPMVSCFTRFRPPRSVHPLRNPSTANCGSYAGRHPGRRSPASCFQ